MNMKKVLWVQLIFSWIYIFCVSIIIVFFLYQRLLIKIIGETTYQSNVVISGSMTPTVPIGSLVISKKVSTNHLNEGDIIVFDNEGERLTHRIVYKSSETIKTKGDANNFFDAGNIIKIYGKVCLVIPKVGYFFLMLGNACGKIALLSTTLNLLLVDSLFNLLYVELKNYRGC